MRITSSECVGIGTTAPLSGLDVRATATMFGDNRINILAFDTTAMAAGVGRGIGFGGYYTSGGTWAEWSGIKSYKDNGTSGDYAAGLAFSTRANGNRKRL